MKALLVLTQVALVTVPAIALGQCPNNHIYVTITYDDNTAITDEYCPNDTITYTNITNAVDHINIWSQTSTDDIGRVYLSGSANTAVRVILGAAAWTGSNPPSGFTVACGDWAGVGRFRHAQTELAHGGQDRGRPDKHRAGWALVPIRR